jgi:hypothetical protein
MDAVYPMASETHGSIHPVHGLIPIGGTRLSLTANMSIRISANQKFGIETQKSEAKIDALSFHVY